MAVSTPRRRSVPCMMDQAHSPYGKPKGRDIRAGHAGKDLLKEASPPRQSIKDSFFFPIPISGIVGAEAGQALELLHAPPWCWGLQDSPNAASRERGCSGGGRAPHGLQELMQGRHAGAGNSGDGEKSGQTIPVPGSQEGGVCLGVDELFSL